MPLSVSVDCWCGHGNDLADQACNCARAIAVPSELLLLTNALTPIAWGRIESWPRLMLSAPFRTGATHVVQFGPVAIAHVHNQVVNDAGEFGDCLGRLAGKTRHRGPARRSRRDRTGADDAFPDHLFLHPVGCGNCDDLADRSCGCARAIAVPVERLLLTPALCQSLAFAGRFQNAAAKAVCDE